MEQTECDVTMT